MIINSNVVVTEVKYWVNESVLDLFSVCMTCSLFIKGDKSWQKYINITRENLCHMYSVRGKSFETGIVTRCQVYCSKIVHTDYPIKIQHFRMLCTKYRILPAWRLKNNPNGIFVIFLDVSVYVWMKSNEHGFSFDVRVITFTC